MSISLKTIARSKLLTFLPLRDAPDADKKAIRLIRNEAPIRKNMYNDHVISADEHARWLRSIPENSQPFLIYAQDTLIGFVSFSRIDMVARKADWAFYLGKEAQGKGYGSATEYFALNYAFETLQLNKLNCEVISWNTDVIALHTRFGFVEEGRKRAEVWRENMYHDVVLLGILADEWYEIRSHLGN